jgi:hypothetical protein
MVSLIGNLEEFRKHVNRVPQHKFSEFFQIPLPFDFHQSEYPIAKLDPIEMTNNIDQESGLA